MNTRKKIQDKSTEQTEDHVPESAYPKEISQQCTPTTHRSSALPEHLGSFIPVSDH